MTTSKLETRRVSEAAVEGRTVTGYAAVFNSETELFPGSREVIRPGAFTRTLRDDPPQAALWNHLTEHPLARTTGRPPLRLWEDDHGLGFEFEPPPTQVGRELLILLRQGIVDGASFGFRALEAPETARNGPDGVTIVRELREVELFEVSPVTFPAYAATEAKIRRLEAVARRGLTDPSFRAVFDRAPPELRAPSRWNPRRDALERELGRL